MCRKVTAKHRSSNSLHTVVFPSHAISKNKYLLARHHAKFSSPLSLLGPKSYSGWIKIMFAARVVLPPSRRSEQTRQCFQMMLPVVAILALLQAYPCLLHDGDDDDSPQRSRIPVIARTRIHVSLVFNQLGPHYTPRAYRMTQDNFFALHRLLFPYVKYRSLRTSGRDHRVRQRKGAANGIVSSSTRLAVETVLRSTNRVSRDSCFCAYVRKLGVPNSRIPTVHSYRYVCRQLFVCRGRPRPAPF